MDRNSRTVFLGLLVNLFLSLGPFYGTATAKVVQPGAAVPGPLSIPFIANQGQYEGRVAYYTLIPGGMAFITRKGEIVYVLGGDEGGVVLKERFLDGREDRVHAENATGARVNWYRGSDRSRWREALPAFGSVSLGEKYDHIEVRLLAGKGGMEKVFTLFPTGDPTRIRGLIEGARSIRIDGSGRLVVDHVRGKFLFTRPVAYQIKDGERLDVKVDYYVDGNEYGFTMGEYDPGLGLVIDPLLTSTYLGGSSDETAYAVGIVDGDIIVAGSADSTDFPGQYGNIDVLGDAVIVRLDPDLSTLRAVSYLGGSLADGIRDIAVGRGTIYAVGYNDSPDFPTSPGAAYAGTSLNGAFVARFDAVTLRMTAATSFYANLFGVAWSQAGRDIYIAGATGNTDLPIPAPGAPAFQSTHRGVADSFIVALDEDLSAVKAATYLGGEGLDIIYSLTVDDSGNPVAAGVTNSAAFPVSSSAFDTSYNLNWETNHQWIDGFVARFSRDLSTLEASTYIGGGSNDYINAVAAQGSAVVVGGSTNSADFPCAFTFGPVDGNDAFVVLMDRDLGKVTSCSVFGGSRSGTGSAESVSAVGFHPSGAVFAAGNTTSSNFPTTKGAFLSHPAGSYFGAFIIAFEPGMTDIEASTLLHGRSETLKDIAFSRFGEVIVAGDSSEGGYPVTPGVLQPQHAGGSDLIVSRFSRDLSGVHIEVVPETVRFGHLPVGMHAVEKIAIHNTGGADLTLVDVGLTSGLRSGFGVGGVCRMVPAFGSCPVEISFKPVVPGQATGRLSIFSDDPFRPQLYVDLEGTAIAVPIINVNRNLLYFGDVNPSTASSPEEIVVTNMGASGLVISEVRLMGKDAGDYSLVLEQCGIRTVGPGKSCMIKAVFLPKVERESLASLEILSNDPLNPEVQIQLMGHGVLSPMVQAEPDPCEFGKVNTGSGKKMAIKIMNGGGADLVLKEISFDEVTDGSFAVTEDTCSGRVLVPEHTGTEESESCEVEIEFSPVSQKKSTGNLRVVSNEPGEPIRLVPINGSGGDPDQLEYGGLAGLIALLVLLLGLVLGPGWKRWTGKNQNREGGWKKYKG